jgi:hypothetical protein
LSGEAAASVIVVDERRPEVRAVALVERLFAILVDCRRIVGELEPNSDRQESPSAEAERHVYYALVGAMEEGLVETAEHILTVLRHAHAPLGPMGEAWMREQERALERPVKRTEGRA